MVFNIGFWEVLIILIIVLILFGPKRLPELARALGESVNEFKKAMAGEPEKTKKKATRKKAKKRRKRKLAG